MSSISATCFTAPFCDIENLITQLDPESVFINAALTVASHPLTFSRILIQLGHEPISPSNSLSLLGQWRPMFPNIFKYMGYLSGVDGFFGLYRGLFPRILGVIVSNYVSQYVAHLLKLEMKSVDVVKAENLNLDILDDECVPIKNVPLLVRKSIIDILSRCAGLIAAHPFHVLMVRSMAQFIGREEDYVHTISGLFRLIFSSDAGGFNTSLMPRLVGEIFGIICVNLLLYGLYQHALPKLTSKLAYSRVSLVAAMAVSHLTYPFNVVGNVMAVNNTDLFVVKDGSPNPYTYDGWLQCFEDLQTSDQIMRGSSLFFRSHVPMSNQKLLDWPS